MTDMRLSGSLGICLMKWLVRKDKPFVVEVKVEILKIAVAAYENIDYNMF